VVWKILKKDWNPECHRHEEAASADKEGAEKFTTKFAELIEEEGHFPQQVLSADKIGLFCKKMPKGTHIT
jgi:hypothetical protein